MSDDPRKDKNQGEGDRESARRYNEHAREFAAHGDPRRAAKDARDAVDGPEGPELAAAEQRGKAPAQLTRLEQLRGLAQRARHAAGDLVAGVRARVGERLSARKS
jgi:hypothetical protein